MEIAAEWAGQLHLRQNDEDSNGDDDDDDANDGDDDDDYANDDDDAIDREFFSPAPISLTGNYWPRYFFLIQTDFIKDFPFQNFHFSYISKFSLFLQE